jgi:cyanophycinase
MARDFERNAQMPATIALVGGAEFQRPCDDMDRALLALAGGAEPRVGILPTAAARENPGKAAENGVRHFRRLGARAEPALIITRADAQTGRLAAPLEEFDLVYLTGGDPVYLLEALRGTYAWQALLRVLARGGVLAGSSAGAMVLGGQAWAPGEGWREGLGAAPGLAVLPHHATLAARWNVDDMRRGLPPAVTLVGLEECAGLAGSGADWQALGAGAVTVYRAAGPEVFTAGQSVTLG